LFVAPSETKWHHPFTRNFRTRSSAQRSPSTTLSAPGFWNPPTKARSAWRSSTAGFTSTGSASFRFSTAGSMSAPTSQTGRGKHHHPRAQIGAGAQRLHGGADHQLPQALRTAGRVPDQLLWGQSGVEEVCECVAMRQVHFPTLRVGGRFFLDINLEGVRGSFHWVLVVGGEREDHTGRLRRFLLEPFRHPKLSPDKSAQGVFDFFVSRDRGYPAVLWILVEIVPPSCSLQATPRAAKLTNERCAFQDLRTSCLR